MNDELAHTNKRSAPDQVIWGFHIIRRGSVDCHMRYRATEYGVRQAAADVKWLQERHPAENYELRAIVSIARGAPADVSTDGAMPSMRAVDEGANTGIDPMEAMAMEADDQEKALARAAAAEAATEGNQ